MSEQESQGAPASRSRWGPRRAALSSLVLEGRRLLPWSLVAGVCSAFTVAGPAVWASLTGRLPGRVPFVVASLLVALVGTLMVGRCVVRTLTGRWPSWSETWVTAPGLLGVPLSSLSLVLAGDLLAGVITGSGGTSPMTARTQVVLGIVVAVLGTAWLAVATTWAAMLLVPGAHSRRPFRSAVAHVLRGRIALARFAAAVLGLLLLALAASIVVSLYLTALFPVPAVQAWVQWVTASLLGAGFVSLFLLAWRGTLGTGLLVEAQSLGAPAGDVAGVTAPRQPAAQGSPGASRRRAGASRIPLRGAVAAVVGIVAAISGLVAWGGRTAGAAGADGQAGIDTGLAVSSPAASAAVADARRATAEAAAAEAFRLAQSGDASDALLASAAAVTADPASIEARLVDGMVNAVDGAAATAETDATALVRLGASAQSEEVLSYLPSVRGGGGSAAVWAVLDDPFLAYSGYPRLVSASLVGSSTSSSAATSSTSPPSGSTPAGATSSRAALDPALDAALGAWIRADSTTYGFGSSSADLQRAGTALIDEEQIAAVIVPGAASGSTAALPGVSTNVADALAQQVLLAAASTANASGMQVGLALLTAPGGTIDATAADELLVAADTYNQLAVELSGGGAQAPPFNGSAAMTQALQLASASSSPEQLKVDAGLWNLLGSQYATAATYFAAAARQDRGDLTARTYEGYAYYELAKFPEALTVLPRGGGEASSSLNETLLGQSYLGVAKSDTSKQAATSDARKAVHYLSSALAQDATPWLTWLGLGDAYTLAGEPKLAISAYQSGLEAGNYDTAIAYPTFSAPTEGYGLTGGVQSASQPASVLSGRINGLESALTSTTTTSTTSTTTSTSTTSTTVPRTTRRSLSTVPSSTTSPSVAASSTTSPSVAASSTTSPSATASSTTSPSAASSAVTTTTAAGSRAG